jgi:predicted site-specific integrase-resolvase
MTFAANLVEYLMVKSAAEFLGVSPSTLRNRDRAGKLRGYPTTQNFRNLLLSQEILRISRQQDMPSCVRPTRLI